MPIPQSCIKDIGIEIRSEYKLNNAPFSIDPGEDGDNFFIGRAKQKEKFLKFLNDSKKGIFLVTGERGIGKTSFVNHTLALYQSVPLEIKQNQTKHNSKENIHPILLTLSQNHPKEIDILWLMVNSVYDKYKAYINDKKAKQQKRPDKFLGNTGMKVLKFLRKEIGISIFLICLIIGLLIFKKSVSIWFFTVFSPLAKEPTIINKFQHYWLLYTICIGLAIIVFFFIFKITHSLQTKSTIQSFKDDYILTEQKRKFKLQKIKGQLFFSIVFCIIPLFIIWKSHESWLITFDSNSNINAESSIHFIEVWIVYTAYIILSIAFACTAIFLWNYLKEKNAGIDMEADDDNAYQRIKRLRERCIASLTEEEGGNEELKMEGIGATLFSGKEKKTKQYSIASTKEIEYELQQFLHLVGGKKVNNIKEKQNDPLEFIFIFDELDKVEPVVASTYLYEDLEKFQKIDNATPRDFRERKQAIINIIAGLKNFFTTANARFVFIAGHEMFDASLADISDRQSSVSSIFTYIFNIESFLKENYINGNINNSSLSIAIENYLKWILFGKDSTNSDIFTIIKSGSFGKPDEEGTREYEYNYIDKPEADLAKAKLLFTLQKFIDYLTYRTNGSPKKIIRVVHEFITIFNQNDIAETSINDEISDKDGVIIKHETKKTLFYLSKKPGKEETKRQFLYFNVKNQYRIGYISYLYSPFLIQHGRSYKSFSDNLIVSTSYLFDHLLKFHPFGFSQSNLELLPEVLSTSKTPSLQDHIRNIIEHLKETHLRKTEIGLFDYKFYSRTVNEIACISRLFEEEAAAFNFTLDESYLVKIYLRSKIKELRSVFSKFLGDTKEAGIQQIFSISHLNGKLGDLHFFDQEYDDAIVAYSDAIRPINSRNIQNIGMRDFITLIRNKLKIGLCFEKINSFDEALSFYSDCCQDAKRFIMYKLKVGKDIELDGEFHKSDFYTTSTLNDLLQIVVQGFLATIIIEEKMGIEGITNYKLGISLGNFLKLADNVKNKSNSGKNNLIIANAFLVTGKLFYFKNTAADINYATEDENEKKKNREEEYKNFDPVTADLLKQLSEKYDPILAGIHLKEYQVKRKPTMALYMYIIGICEVMESKKVMPGLFEDLITKSGTNLLDEMMKYYKSGDERLLGDHFRYIASFLSSIGDVLWSMCVQAEGVCKKINMSDLFDKEKIKHSKGRYEGGFYDFVKTGDKATPHLCDVIKYYYLSGKFFLRYGRERSRSYQYRKILYVLKTVLQDDATPDSDEKKDDRKLYKDFLEATLITPILEIISKTGGHTDRQMIAKGKSLVKSLKIDGSFIKNNISNHPDTREVILTYNYIRLKMGDVIDEEVKNLISPYNSIGTQYGRITELDFYAKYIYSKINKTDYEKTNKTEKNKDIIEYLYTMITMLRIQRIYGNDFILGTHSFAHNHFKLAEFLSTKEIDNNSKDIQDELKKIFRENTLTSLDPTYHYQVARDFYIKTIQLHTAGNEYKKTIAEMVYLEDDFNENAYHFGAALNRYLMINGVFHDNVDVCNKKIKQDDNYNSGMYLH